jgi:hypothetical protein
LGCWTWQLRKREGNKQTSKRTKEIELNEIIKGFLGFFKFQSENVSNKRENVWRSLVNMLNSFIFHRNRRNYGSSSWRYTGIISISWFHFFPNLFHNVEISILWIFDLAFEKWGCDCIDMGCFSSNKVWS